MNKADWGMQLVMDRVTHPRNPGFCVWCTKKLNFFNRREVYAGFGFVDEYCRDCYRLREELIKKGEIHEEKEETQ